MALPAGLTDLLKTGNAESHSTVQITVDDADAPAVLAYRLATGVIDTPDGAFAAGLVSAGEIKAALDASTDTAEVSLDDVACRWTPLLINQIETLQGAQAIVGRYWRDLNTGQKYHAKLMTGVVTGARASDQTMALSIISDVYAARSVGANKPIRKKCGLEFKGTACGYTGGLTTCNKLLNDTDGCSGRSNTFRFGGEDALDPAQTVTSAGALKPPANYTLLKDSAGTTLAMRPALKIMGGTLTDDAGNDLTMLDIAGAENLLGYYFVDSPTYGAVGDGSTNDSTAIQAAIDAAYTAGGGVVFFGAKTYKATGLVLKDKVWLQGSNMRDSVIYSTTNAAILSVSTTATNGGVTNLSIKGTTGAGSSQKGLAIAGSGQYWGFTVRDLWIEDCGGRGLQVGDGTNNGPFSTVLENIHVSNCEGYPFVFDTTIAPCITVRDSYAHTLRAAAPVGFRVRSGFVRLENCNGIDNSPALTNSKWALVGRKNGVDGDTVPLSAALALVNCNVESFDTHGVHCYHGSRVDLLGRTIFAGGGNVNQIGVEFEHINDGTDYFSQYITRGYVDDAVDFGDGAAAYKNSQPIHANGCPPLELLGAGANLGNTSVAPLASFYNTTVSATQRLPRADGKVSVQVVTGTLTIAQPGVKYIELNHTGTMTLTLPYPGWYFRAQEPLIIKDRSASGCATYNVTISTAGGSTVNSSTFTMNKTGQAIVLVPDGAGDWRVVAEYNPNALLNTGTQQLAGAFLADDIYVQGYSASGATAPGYYRRRHRGSSGSPAAVQSGDTLAYDVWEGQYDTTGGHRTGGAYIVVAATENWDATHAGTKIQVSAAPNASTDGFAKKWLFDPTNGGGSFIPGATNAQDLGIPGAAWCNLLLRNEASAVAKLFTQTSKVTVANNAAETTLLSGAPTLTVDANSVAVGTTFTIEAWGYGAKTSSTTRWRLKLGSLTLCDSTALGWAPTGSRMWHLKAIVTVYTIGASGTIAAEGILRLFNTATTETIQECLNTGTATLDTTAAQTFDLTIQHGATGAGNTASCTNCTIERAF